MKHSVIRGVWYLLALVGLLACASAQAGTRWSVLGGVGFSDTKFVGAGTDNGTAGLGFGGGLGLEFGGPFLSVEVDAIYVLRKVVSPTASLTHPNLQIPIIARIGLGSIISIGAGGYLALGIGSVGSSIGPSVSYASVYKTLDYGITTSLAFDFKIGPATSLVLDGRYCLGLADVSVNSAGSMKWSDIQVFTGVRFGALK